ncbi:MAG TPA: hypothetical protein VFY18_13455 [Candidatus Limnocylindrales bacterium]|nr:hypothetical protein [Candidatus Limnocylindrales bacterium]
MRAIRRRIAPAPARRLLRDAGPPTWQNVVAIVLAAAVGGFVYAQPGLGLWPTILIALVITTVPAALDLDGWRIRRGMAWLAAEQRRRMSDLPRTPAGADRWLAGSGESAPELTRASILLMTDRLAEARALVDAFQPATTEDRARRERLVAAFDGMRSGTVDPRGALAAIEALPPADQPYHRISLAWSTAWVNSSNRLPWRAAFAEASRTIGRVSIPARFLVWHAVQELLLPICLLIVFAIALVVGWR